MHDGWFEEDTTHGPVRVDTFDESRPHEGKVLGIVQAHADDMPLCSGGLVAKLVAEGYKAFIIQTTNDEKCGPGSSGDAIKSNEVDVDALAKSLGIEDVFNLGYRNHRQEENSMLEQRCRLIFLFRIRPTTRHGNQQQSKNVEKRRELVKKMQVTYINP